MISLVWQKWNQSPVILSFDNKLMTMASIPFPAVTGKNFIEFILFLNYVTNAKYDSLHGSKGRCWYYELS